MADNLGKGDTNMDQANLMKFLKVNKFYYTFF